MECRREFFPRLWTRALSDTRHLEVQGFLLLLPGASVPRFELRGFTSQCVEEGGLWYPDDRRPDREEILEYLPHLQPLALVAGADHEGRPPCIEGKAWFWVHKQSDMTDEERAVYLSRGLRIDIHMARRAVNRVAQKLSAVELRSCDLQEGLAMAKWKVARAQKVKAEFLTWVRRFRKKWARDAERAAQLLGATPGEWARFLELRPWASS